ncbi:MAG: T9SS type A sorting domain-containing protein [Bacteroidota bacterium]
MRTKLIKSRILFAAIVFLSFTVKSFAQSADIVGPTINCQGTPLTLTVNINGLTGPYTYLWQFGGQTTSTITINNNALVRVQVTGTNANGNQQTVNSPFRIFLFFSAPNATILASGPTTFCDGGSVVLSAIGGNPFSQYLWSTGETTQNITVTTAGTYYVAIAQSFTGCASVSAPVTVTTTTIAASITPNGPITLCPGQTIDLTANGGTVSSTYLWSNGETTQTITVSISGSYNVVITDGSCEGTAPSVDVEVLDPNFEPKFTADGPVTFCKPGSVTLTADVGYTSYTWSTGETTQSITVTLTGAGSGPNLDTLSVWVTVEINSLCSFTSGAVVVRSIREPDLVVGCDNYNMALSTDQIKAGRVLPINGLEPDYEFEFVETTLQGVSNGTAIQTRWLNLSSVTPALEVGKFYNVRCRGIVDGQAFCYGSFCSIGIASLRSEGTSHIEYDDEGQPYLVRDGLNFGIYPNPSNSSFTANVFTLDENPVSVKILDLSGREISSAQFDASQSQYEFGSDLKAGIYFVQFSQGGNLQQTAKLIKTN